MGCVSGKLLGCFGLAEPANSSAATTAVRDGDAFVLSGVKSRVANAPLADLFIVWAEVGLLERSTSKQHLPSLLWEKLLLPAAAGNSLSILAAGRE